MIATRLDGAVAVEEQATEVGTPARGFILQASYRVQNGSPVVYLFGVLEDGGTFLVRDHRQVPHFYVRRGDAARAYALGATRQFETARRTFSGDPVVRVDVAVPRDTVQVRERLHGDGIATFEADVRFAVRYLIDRDIRGGCEILGEFEPGDRIARVYDDPVLRPADVALTPSVLSFDIETDPRARRLLAISVYGEGVDEVYIVEPEGREMPLAPSRAPMSAPRLPASSNGSRRPTPTS